MLKAIFGVGKMDFLKYADIKMLDSYVEMKRSDQERAKKTKN